MLLSHVSALSLTLVLYLILAVAYFGWGKATGYLLGLNNQENSPVTFFIWMGWSFSLLIFQLLHFIFPLTAFVVIPVFIVGVAVAIFEFFQKPRCRLAPPAWDTIVIFLGVAIVVLTVSSWIASRSMLPPTSRDSALYHFNAIRWINSYSIVPGLGNLHGRLAFNQSFFAYVASLNFHPFFGQGRSIANSFLFLLTIATCVDFLRPVCKSPALLVRSHPFQYVPSLLVISLLGYLAISSNGLASPTPDLTSTLLQLVMFLILASGIGDWITDSREQANRATFLLVLAATAVTIKLSNLVFSAVVMGFVASYAWKSSSWRILSPARILLPSIMLLVWCLRGFLYSGAPLYPSRIGYVPVDWAVPLKNVVNEANWIFSWARLPGVHWNKVLGNWDWLNPWLLSMFESKNIIDVAYPMALVIIFSTAMLVILFKKGWRLQLIELALLFPSILGLIYWFFTAPDPRFANALLFLLPISLVLLFIVSIQHVVGEKVLAGIICVVFALSNAHFLAYAIYRSDRLTEFSISGWHAIKTVPLNTMVTKSGLVVHTPKIRDLCWDAPLLCTPYFNDDLRLIVPNDIGSGFTLSKEDSQGDGAVKSVAGSQ